MDNIKLIPSLHHVLTFSLHVPKDFHVLNINIHDVLTDDILLHIDFRHPDKKIVTNDKHSNRWGEEQHYNFDYGAQFFSGSLTFQNETVLLKIADWSIEIPLARPPIGRLLRLYSDFRFISLGSSATHEVAFARRWPFFPDQPTPPVANTRFSRPAKLGRAKTGLTALILYDGDAQRLAQFCEKATKSFDEMLVVVTDGSNLDLSGLRRLQSRFFHLKYTVADQTAEDNGASRELRRSLFLNYVLTQVGRSQVMFVQPDPESAPAIEALVRQHRLRSRKDPFVLFNRYGGRADLLAFSCAETTSFKWSDNGVLFYPESLVGRTPETADTSLAPIGPDWSVDSEAIFSLATKPEFGVKAYYHSTGHQAVVQKRGKLLVLITSCKNNRDRQDAIRETWALDLETAGIEYRFVEGDPSLETAINSDDHLLVPAPDSYEYLSHKIWQSMNAARDLYPGCHVLKIDDDCVLNVSKLLEFNYEDYDYIGTDISVGRQSYVDWHFGAVSNTQLNDIVFELADDVTWYDGQGSYFLSPKAIEVVAGTPLMEFQHLLEDYAVGRVLGSSGLSADRTSSRFQAIREIYIDKDQDYERAMIADVGNIERMHEIYRRLSEVNAEQMQKAGGTKLSVTDS